MDCNADGRSCDTKLMCDLNAPYIAVHPLQSVYYFQIVFCFLLAKH